MISRVLEASVFSLGLGLIFLGSVSCTAPSSKPSHSIPRSSASIVEAPKCIAIGTKSEGWSFPGQPIIYENCHDRHIECTNEGWVSYTKKNSRVLKYANCADSSAELKCVAIGTKSEGWSLPGEPIHYDNCANRSIACGAIGTKSESWITFEKSDTRSVLQTNCQ